MNLKLELIRLYSPIDKFTERIRLRIGKLFVKLADSIDRSASDHYLYPNRQSCFSRRASPALSSLNTSLTARSLAAIANFIHPASFNPVYEHTGQTWNHPQSHQFSNKPFKTWNDYVEPFDDANIRLGDGKLAAMAAEAYRSGIYSEIKSDDELATAKTIQETEEGNKLYESRNPKSTNQG